MVIGTLDLLSGLFMVAFEVSRASPTKKIQGESVVVKLYSALWRHVQTSESLSYHLKGLIQPLRPNVVPQRFEPASEMPELTPDWHELASDWPEPASGRPELTLRGLAGIARPEHAPKRPEPGFERPE